jgi:multicomponent Na+:H+ antiporter subunit E
MQSLTLNLVIAVIWLLLSAEPSFLAFLHGLLLGFAFLALFQRVMNSGQYVRRTLAFFRFVFVFLREFLMANYAVTKTILFGSMKDLYPNFITLDVAGMQPFEIVLLSYCITLTPGTTSVDIDEPFQTLIVHALDAKDPVAVRDSINRSLRDSILSFTR